MKQPWQPQNCQRRRSLVEKQVRSKEEGDKEFKFESKPKAGRHITTEQSFMTESSSKFEAVFAIKEESAEY